MNHITLQLSRRDVQSIVDGDPSVRATNIAERALAASPRPGGPGGAVVLVADPPWRYRDKLPGGGRGAAKHYPTLSTPEIMRFPLPPLASDCWLFLWRLHTHQHDALRVAEAWGFGLPVSELVWIKQTRDRSRPAMGMGHSLRMAHEICMIFKRGKPARASRSIPSVVHSPRLEHSRKPEEFYRLVEDFAGDVSRVELFARRHREGWACFGNELTEGGA